MKKLYFKNTVDFDYFLKKPYYSLFEKNSSIKVISSVTYQVSTVKEIYSLIHKMILFCKLFIFIIFSLGTVFLFSKKYMLRNCKILKDGHQLIKLYVRFKAKDNNFIVEKKDVNLPLETNNDGSIQKEEESQKDKENINSLNDNTPIDEKNDINTSSETKNNGSIQQGEKQEKKENINSLNYDNPIDEKEEIIPIIEPFKKNLTNQELIDALVNNPEKLLIKGVMKNYPNIFECHCTPQLARRKDKPDKRKIFVEKLIELVKEKYPLPRKKPIRICSIASAGCFQELVVHANLVKLGYKVDWCLVDPIYFKSESPEKHPIIADFSKLAKSMSKETEIKVGCDFQSFFAEKERVKTFNQEIFLLIDPDLHGTFGEIKLGKFWKEFPEEYNKYIGRHPIDFWRKDTESAIITYICKLRLLMKHSIKHKRIYVSTNKKEGKTDFYIRYYGEKTSQNSSIEF